GRMRRRRRALETRQEALRCRAAGRVDDVGGYVRDLLRADPRPERGAPGPAVGHLRRDGTVVGLELVEVRADGAGGVRGRERMAASAAAARVHRAALLRVTLEMEGRDDREGRGRGRRLERAGVV